MVESANQSATTEKPKLELRSYLKLEPVQLAVLTAIAVVSFLAVTGLSRLYRAQQESLGERWYTRGAADLSTRNFSQAMLEFRTALRYSRDNYDYQLNLAESLLGLKRTQEAYAYFINLWEREPENGVVNVELARIAAASGQKDQTERYYHNAIYATWPGDQAVQRRETRIELIEYLLKIGASEQAQSELIALEANLGNDPEQQVRVGDLFMRAHDYKHALAAYTESLRSNRNNEAATAGAGWAAFETADYPLAKKYLQAVVALNPKDSQSATRLETTDLVLQMDPFQRGLSAGHRNRIVVNAFQAVGERLKSCGGTAGSTASATSRLGLANTWSALKPRITERGLDGDPDLVESAMGLVFEIERETAVCAAESAPDQALLLISKLHEGR
jgi:tetratricopeptide (TPR) repeat protein